jgi:hypothetical protein
MRVSRLFGESACIEAMKYWGNKPLPRDMHVVGIAIDMDEPYMKHALLTDNDTGIYYIGAHGKLIARPGGF